MTDKDATIAKLREQGRIMVAAADRHFNTAMENHRECERLQEQLTERDAELAKLREENEALRQDAERYRWFKKRTFSVITIANKWGDGDIVLTTPKMDDQIDAALAASSTERAGHNTKGE